MPALKVRLRRIRFWWHLGSAYFLRYKTWIAIIIGVSIVSTFTLYKAIPHIFRGNIVTVGYVGTYKLEEIPSEVLSLVTQPLIDVDESGKPVPSLASHWQISEDGKTYIVFLKDNLKWHDDTPTFAKDLTIAIANVKITALNNKAIEFQLPNPIVSFPTALNRPVFKAKTFYGTGQFRLVHIDEVEGMVRKVSLVAKDKKLPKVDIKFYPNREQAESALKVGEVKSISISEAQNFEKWPNLNTIKTLKEDEIVTIFYNTQDPELSSRELRQSLNYAINKSEFDGEVALGPLSPSNWAFNSDIRRYDYNTGRAKELLVKSQVKDPKITLSVTPGLEKVAELVKKDWEALGIKVELSQTKSIPQNYQALLAINKIDPDPDQYPLWHSTQTNTNITKYNNKKIDKLLEDARITTDEEKRKALYHDFQKTLLDDAPASFLFHPYTYQVTYKNIQPLLDKLPK